jgi:hypothetical protein
MKKAVKIVIISVAAVVVLAMGVLFIVFPLATAKIAEARLSEALAGAGIPEDMWSVDRVYYVPLFGVVAEKVKFGENGGDTSLEAKKITLAIDMGSEDFFGGSVDARKVSFSTGDTSITVKKLSVNDFSVDTALFGYSPVEAVKELENIRLNNVVFRQDGETYFSLGKLNVKAGYAEGKSPLPSSISLKKFIMDVRQFAPFSTLRPEYKLSNLDLKISPSGDTVNLIINGAKLFTIKVDLGLSLPRELLASGGISSLALIDFEEDVKINSLVLTYTDKSFLDHVFELAGMPSGRERTVDQLNETFMEFAMMSGVDAERFVNEATKFIAKPGKFELKTNINSPVSFEDIFQNPLAMNLSLSINGGKPFTTGEH